jgi:hypothetical protein
MANSLHKMTSFYFKSEQQRSKKIIQDLENIHLKFVNILQKKDGDIERLLYKFKHEIENKFSNKASVAIINKDLIIEYTTLKSEIGLDLKQYDDAVYTTKKILSKNNISYVNIAFPVYTRATNNFKIYSLSYVPALQVFFQIGLTTDYLNNFSSLLVNNEYAKNYLYCSIGMKKMNTYNLKNGEQVSMESNLEKLILKQNASFVEDSLLYRTFYFNISAFPYIDNFDRTYITLKVEISKKPIYYNILIILILEIIIFLILFYVIKSNQNFYKNNFLIPFKSILNKIRKSEIIDSEEFDIKELYIISKQYNKNLKELKNKQKELEEAIHEISTLKELLPICSSCKKIKGDDGSWHNMDSYVNKNKKVDFTHGICPECSKKLYPDFTEDKVDKKE